MARRRFFVDEIHHQQAQVTGDDAHHLTRVLRVEKGQRFEISDNSAAYLADVIEARKDRVLFQVLEKISDRPPAVHLTLLISLIKFDRLEWILEKATELGVCSFILIEADRSEKGLARAAAKRATRWRRILLESSQQSRRDRLPELLEPAPLREALSREFSHRYMLEEDGAPPILTQTPRCPSQEDHAGLLLGPEGGWTDRERQWALEQGWSPVSLGPNILRSETAAIAAVAVLTAAWLAAQRTSNVSVAQ
jgi:16S rRNA (uracil1498-N3)-methyltransferase